MRTAWEMFVRLLGKIAAMLVVMTGFFSAGFMAATVINTDILCDDEVPVKVSKNLRFSGVLVEKGAIIKLRECQYANRFRIDFYMPKELEVEELESINASINDRVNYSGGGLLE